VIQYMLCIDNQTVSGGPELLQQWHSNPQSWLWVDLYQESTEQETRLLRDEFNIDAHAIAEAQLQRHPPNYEIFDDYIYLLLKPLDADSHSLEFSTLQLALFFSPRFLITRHTKESPFLNKRWHELLSSDNSAETPLSIVTSIANRVANRYGNVLLDLEQRLDVIEDELFESPSDVLMKELVGYNTGLRKMHRILAYYVNVFGNLREKRQLSSNISTDDFDDVYISVERFYSMSNLYQSVITDLIEAYISLNGHRLNQIMKVLTVVTVIFVPLTLLVGIYGMNFEYMPELKSKNGYYILLSVMSGIVILLMYFFRRMRWI